MRRSASRRGSRRFRHGIRLLTNRDAVVSGATSAGPSSGGAGSARLTSGSAGSARRTSCMIIFSVRSAERPRWPQHWAIRPARRLHLACRSDFGRIGGRRKGAGIVRRDGRRLLSLRIWRRVGCCRRHRRHSNLVCGSALHGIGRRESALVLCRLRALCRRRLVRSSRQRRSWLRGDRRHRICRVRSGWRRGCESVRDTNGHSDRFFGVDNPAVPKVSPQNQSRECGHRQKDRGARERFQWSAPARPACRPSGFARIRNSELAGHCLSLFHLGQAILELPVERERIAWPCVRICRQHLGKQTPDLFRHGAHLVYGQSRLRGCTAIGPFGAISGGAPVKRNHIVHPSE